MPVRPPGESGPDDALARLQRGMLRLQHRDFRAGWIDYEARWDVASFVANARGVVSVPMVQELARVPSVADLTGRRILLVGEQGLGDQVMFASMLADLAAVAAEVVCVCDPRLVGLFRASFGQVTVLDPREAKVDTESIELVVAMGSLGAAFRPDAAAFPGTAYLRPTDEARARWAARLGPRTGARRVGLAWEGGLATTGQPARSLTLDELAPVLALPGCDFISLQHGAVEAQLARANAERASPIRSFPPADIADFDNLAALVGELDVVVSVQTALVHLCGALGAPCLALLRGDANWRYMDGAASVPWYRSVRLVRQPEAGEWAPVVQAAAETLAHG